MIADEVPGEEAKSSAAGKTRPGGQQLPLLVLGALGVVYGDIGTSPIYAFREALAAAAGEGALEQRVLGLLSLIFWTLTLTVTVKYVFFVTRADNKGEGGTLSLMTLAAQSFEKAPLAIPALGVAGAALFFGDAMITPAISVLSAVEGLELLAPRLHFWVIPITLAVIVALFLVQRLGTARVGAAFGPLTALWFLVLALSGLAQIIANPLVLGALNPLYAVTFIAGHPGLAFVVLGAVFLAVPGPEAFYVDVVHFGRRAMVIPCLLLNYFGQGAYVLSASPGTVTSPFYEMQPQWALLPFIGLSTLATIIASQAVISGIYSLTGQAVALNLLPRMRVLHTSDTQSGQIYMPQINSLLMIMVLVMVLGFGSSQALSAAYGVAVSAIMVVTLCLLLVVMWRKWRWPRLLVVLFALFYLVIDGGFFLANAAKFDDGGWVPLAVAALLSGVMVIWIRGSSRLSEKTRRDEIPLDSLLESLEAKERTIVPGTAIFLTAHPENAPTALLQD